MIGIAGAIFFIVQTGALIQEGLIPILLNILIAERSRIVQYPTKMHMIIKRVLFPET
jgi:hypothetical protein